MTKFILRRLGKGLLTIWFIWTLVFVLVRISGDPVEMMLPDEAQESVRQELRSSLGLDLPLEQQYIKTFTNIFNGDFGKSFYYKRSVADLYAERMVNSYSIALPAYALSTILGIAFGVIAAIRHDTAIDRAVMTGAVISLFPLVVIAALTAALRFA